VRVRPAPRALHVPPMGGLAGGAQAAVVADELPVFALRRPRHGPVAELPAAAQHPDDPVTLLGAVDQVPDARLSLARSEERMPRRARFECAPGGGVERILTRVLHGGSSLNGAARPLR